MMESAVIIELQLFKTNSFTLIHKKGEKREEGEAEQIPGYTYQKKLFSQYSQSYLITRCIA